MSAGRSVLVTGGNRGIGLAVARAFAALGDRVAVTQHANPAPEEFFAVKCDVGDPASVRSAVDTVIAEQGGVDVLVCCAGITRDGLAVRMPDHDWYDVIDTNLTGTWAAVRAVLPGMLRARSGRIVLTSSAVAMLGSAGQVNYAAAKAGLIGMARSIAREYAARDVTCNVVSPGLITTDMTDQLTDAQRDGIVALTPAGRPGSADDVAAAVTFLAGPGASYITGAVLPVDGGLGMGH